MKNKLTPKQAYWKLDHTVCMNEKNLKFNIDNKDDPELYDNGKGYDPIDTDCKSMGEAIDCLETIESALKEKEQFEDLVGMDLALFSKAVDINGLIEDAKKNEKSLKALEIIKELIYIDDNNQIRLLPGNKTLTATKSLDHDKAELLKEVLK